MKKSSIFCILFTLIFLLITNMVLCWGFWAHQRINRMAVFTLPIEMFGFYKYHIDFITVHAVDPDKRRYAMEGEAACHYIDLDRYGLHPFDSIPRKWNEAVAKYTEDTLMAHGIVPWHIEKMMYRLTNAFKRKDFAKILKYSAELGHYIGDAHVPLHCTQNYNGQLTNQHGIHGFWESRIPELFGEDYDYLLGQCEYIESPLSEAWNIVQQSYAAHDSVLLFERLLNERFSPDKKYSLEQKGTITSRVYSYEYTKAYDEMLNGMVERRMRSAIIKVSSFWYTAWVNAGQPDLLFENNFTFENNDTLSDVKDSVKVKLINVGGHTD